MFVKSLTSKDEVELVLNQATKIAREQILSGELRYGSGIENEFALFLILKEACVISGFRNDSVELVGGHKFPDVVFKDANIGLEIKGHRSGDRILGNSIMGSTPSLKSPIAIYLLVWNDSARKVIWRDYFDCVVGAEVTHSPRFVLKPDCSESESLFGDQEWQIGLASEVCLGSDGFKSEVILAKMRAKALAEGNIPWWITPADGGVEGPNGPAISQMAVVKYSKLDPALERPAFLKTLIIGFPEILGKSQSKFDSALVWSLMRKSVLITRDAFTAGGKIAVSIPQVCSREDLLVPQVFVTARNLLGGPHKVSSMDISEIWGLRLESSTSIGAHLNTLISKSGVSAHARSILHRNCECSTLSEEEFSRKISDWLLASFDPRTIE